MIRAVEDGDFLLSGLAPLEDVSDELDIQFGEEEQEAYDTIGGFLISRLGRIPKEDERPVIPYGGYEFQVKQVENKRISLIKAVKKSNDTDTCQQEKMVVE